LQTTTKSDFENALHETNGGMNMSQNSGTSKRSEKGLLTPDNCVVALIDHQPQMLFGTQ
jgi:hypothetical protein